MNTHGDELVRYARASIREALGGPPATPPAGCEALGASFVTVRWRDGRLQGCMGSLEARHPLASDVSHNAVAAALVDPRAESLTLADVDDLHVELSILSPLEPVTFADEEGARGSLTPGVHGAVLGLRGRRATFLPSMWEHFGDARAMLDALKEKAGLPAEFWDKDMKMWRYTVEKHVDPAPARCAA